MAPGGATKGESKTSLLVRILTMAPKWTDETRRQRWIRAYIVNGVCVIASVVQVVYAHVGCPVGYSKVFNGVNDPLNVVRVGITVSMSAALLTGYGTGLCFLLAKRKGQWAGGFIGQNVYLFLVTSFVLCIALTIVSSTTLHMALGLRMHKDVFDRSMRTYLKQITVKKVFDKIQSELHCCGNKRYDDWFDIPWAKSSSLASGEFVGFPLSCCNRALIAKSVKCISTVRRDRLGDLQPHLEGCYEALRRRIRSSMMTLSFVSLPMTIAFCWNTINIFRTITSRPRTSQDDVEERLVRERAAKRRADTRRETAHRRVDAMRRNEASREARKVARSTALKQNSALAKAVDRDRLRREEQERRQTERERAMREPLERALIDEQRLWERELKRKFKEDVRKLAEQEKAIVEMREQELHELVPVMQRLERQEQEILLDEQRRLKLLLPKTNSSFLLNKFDD